MGDQEHDRRALDLLESLSMVIGPLLKFQKATKHALVLEMEGVDKDVRRQLVAPWIARANIRHSFRRVAIRAEPPTGGKLRRFIYFTRQPEIGHKWVLRIKFKTILLNKVKFYVHQRWLASPYVGHVWYMARLSPGEYGVPEIVDALKQYLAGARPGNYTITIPRNGWTSF